MIEAIRSLQDARIEPDVWKIEGALHKKSRSLSSLCNLSVLCVSVVDEFRVKPHHRDTEDTEVAQRNPRTRTFCAKPTRTKNDPELFEAKPGVINIFSWPMWPTKSCVTVHGRILSQDPLGEE